MEQVDSFHFPVGKEKRENFLALVMMILLVCLVAMHIAVSWELNQAKEIINSQSKELALKYTVIWEQPPQSDLKSLIETRIQNLQPKLDPFLRQKIANAILENSNKYKLSPSLIIHLIHRESTFNPLSKSKKDAVGLMQVMYKVHKRDIPELTKIKAKKLYHIDNNIKFGCQILRKYIDSTKSLDKALKKYVGGEVKEYVADIYRLMAEWEQGKCD